MDGSSLHHQLHRHMRPMEQQQQHQHPPPPPPQGPWYSVQFQYQPPHPPPAPHHHLQPQFPQPPQPHWVPPPDYPQMQFPHRHPPPPPLPGPPHYGSAIGSYPPPPHHYPPLPSRPLPSPQVTQMYGQPDQPWNNSSWPQNQYPDHSIPHYNEEDWAARARAWAAAKVAMENQQMEPTFTPLGRVEEQNPAYHEYHQTVEPHGTDIQQSPVPAPSHQPFPDSLTDHNRSSNQFQQASSFSSEPLSYHHDDHAPHSAKVVTFAADPKLVSAAPEGSIFSSSSVYQQDLTSVYSSVPVAGNDEVRHESGPHQSSVLPPVPSINGGEHYSQSIPPVASGLSSMQSPSYMYGDESAVPVRDASDQSLDIDHSSVHKHEHQHPISYVHSAPSGLVGGSDQISPAAAIHTWTAPVAPGVFPTVPPVPPGPQLESSFVPHALGHPAPVFGGVSGPNFRPTIPPISAPFGLSTGAPMQIASAFPTDVNGTFSISERPKKASVPSWLRDEIMKKKAAVMSSSVQDQSLELPVHSNDADGADKVSKKIDHDDNKSIDSARSTEDEEDEVDVEAERSAVLNQEIKRILTEVLLKVTDELFDEIATKVMEEDDLAVEVPTNSKLPSSTPIASTPKASARVLVPAKHNNSSEAAIDQKSSFSSPGGNVLGLANYASDDDEVDSSGQGIAQNGSAINGEDLLLNTEAEDPHEKVEPKGGFSTLDSQHNDAVASMVAQDALNNKSVNDITRKASAFSSSTLKSEDGKVSAGSMDHSGAREEQMDAADKSKTDALQVKANAMSLKGKTAEHSCRNPADSEKASIDEFPDRIGIKKFSDSEYDTKKGSSASRHDRKELETDKSRRNQRKSNPSNARKEQENRVIQKEKFRERNEVDKLKDKGAKLVGKSLDSDSGSSFNHINAKEDDKLVDKTRRANVKDDGTKKRERPREEKEDRSKHRDKKDSYKKHHSSSNSGRGRSSRAGSSSSERSGSSYGSSDDARKFQTGKHSSSPVRSRPRKRQFSRSPNSRHSQRKHSPYSSHDTRNRRSRSISPVRRHR